MLPKPLKGRTPLLYQASIRLFRGMAVATLVIGLLTLWVLSISQEKSSWLEIHNATEYFAEGITDRERRWEEAAVRYKSRVEFARLLEDPEDRWTKLNSYLITQNNGELFPALLITGLDNKVRFAFGLADESIPAAFASPPDLGWHYDRHSGTLYRYYVLHMWLGVEGMGRLVLLRPMDHALLGQMASLNTNLFLRWHGQIIASSLGETGKQVPLLPRSGRLEYQGLTFMQDALTWETSHPDSPELVIHRETQNLFNSWEIALGILIALTALFSAQWASMGMWIFRTTGRITLVGDASRQFILDGHPSQELKALLVKACRTTDDEINEVVRSLESLANTVAQQNAERDAYEKTLQESEERFRLISTSAMEAIIIVDQAENIAYWNPAAERIFGYRAEDVLGSNLHHILPSSRLWEGSQRDFPHLLNTGTEIGKPLEMTALRRNGEQFPVEISISTLRIKDHRHALGIIRDISERKKAEEQIRQLAYYDTLTNLPNRRLLLDRLNQAIYHAQRHHRALAVMFLDLDRFKQINDTLGHDAGDQLLQEVATRLTACTRSGDTVSRQGGDEFVIILAEIGQPEDAALVAEKIIEALARPVLIKGHALHVTISIGIAIHAANAIEDVDELMKKADTAMYAAKEAGRNDYRFSVE